MNRSLRLSLLLIVVAVLLGGAWTLRSQQSSTREKRPPKPGTLRAKIQDPTISGEIRLGLHVEWPGFPTLDAIADASDAVIRGKVVGLRSFPCHRDRFVCTQFRVSVAEILWGSIPEDRRGTDRIPTWTPGKASTFPGPGPNEIVVTQEGGVLFMEGRRIVAKVSDEKTLKKDQEYILFLSWIPPERSTIQGSNTYLLAAGMQGVIEVDGESVKSMIALVDAGHPVNLEVERTFQGNRVLLFAHFEERRLGRRP